MALHELPDLIQGSEEWHDQRRGMVTASVVGRLITTRSLTAINYKCPECGALADRPCFSKRGAGEIKTLHAGRTVPSDAPTLLEAADNDESRGLTAFLVAERITGYTEPTFMNSDMWRGVEDEPRARDAYGEHYAPAVEVGFMVRDDWGFRIGYSPDGLVGDDGLIEVKSRRQKKHLTTILSDEAPTENMAQLQCGLLVSGRAWIDYLSYCGGMPMYRKRVYPDTKWFAAIEEAVTTFESNAARMVADYESATEGLALTERVLELEMSL